MKAIQQHILNTIYARFDAWNRDRNKACKGGCAACCTQNVVVTSPEAALIHEAMFQAGKSDWLAAILSQKRKSSKPVMTTNTFARACLRGETVDPGALENYAPCPFLLDGLCQIYEVRPFSCRAFISTTVCSAHHPATVSEQYTAATTAVCQIIEHLGQKGYYGHLFDVLTVLAEHPKYQGAAQLLTPDTIRECRLKLLTAQPLPGFLLTEEDLELAEPLLVTIFESKIDNRTVEEILNGVH